MLPTNIFAPLKAPKPLMDFVYTAFPESGYTAQVSIVDSPLLLTSAQINVAAPALKTTHVIWRDATFITFKFNNEFLR